jgi:hypothetical protein
MRSRSFECWGAIGAAVVGLALLAVTAWAGEEQDQEVRKLPGYVDFGPMASIFGEEDATVEVFLEPNLLSMVAAVTQNSDPELSDMLRKLKQIRVQTYKIGESRADKVEEKTTEVAKRLEGNGWQTVVRVRERRQERTYVYMKWVDKKVQGLVVMNVNPHEDEASFVNIVGEIDPEQLGRLGHKFNIDALDDSLDYRDRHDSDKNKDKGKDKSRN